MTVNKKFIEKGIRRNKMEEFLNNSFDRAGYSHSEIKRTPVRTRIVIYADKPGLVIGRGGSKIKEVTRDLKNEFDLDNPQLDVEEIDKPELNAKIVAEEITNALEKGVNHRKMGHIMLRRIMESGAVGAEIRISGKLGSSRGRTDRFVDGYLKHCGNSAKELVDRAQTKAITPLGSIGIKVKIMEEFPEGTSLKLLQEEGIEEESEEEDSPEETEDESVEEKEEDEKKNKEEREEEDEKKDRYECPECGREFGSKRGLSIHMSQKHPDEEDD
ncbi:MAG: 30S ribosomal protein S3 [Candidatus Aenigmatarchaeota archaeon]